jgi:hypothetical protein
MNTAKAYPGGAGIQTAGLAFGGQTPANTAATEEYDGTNWTTVNSLNTARQQLAGAGTQPAALAIGGYTTASTAATEEWLGAGSPTTKTITVS